MSIPSWAADYSECQPENLDIFRKPDLMTAIESVSYVDVRPLSQIVVGNSPLEFMISKSKLFLKVHVVHEDGSPLAAEEHCAPVNNFMHALFSQVDVYMNSRIIASSGDLYPYLAYMKTLFSSTSDEKRTLLNSMLWIPDSPGFFSATDPKAGNTGLFDRANYVTQSKPLDLVSVPLNDIFDISRYLLNGCDVKLIMYRTKPEFCLMADTKEAGVSGYRIIIDDCFLMVCKLAINPAILLAQSQQLKNSNLAIYPIVKREVRCASIAKNKKKKNWDHLFQNRAPRTVIIGLVSSTSVLGNYLENPYEFQHFNLRKIGVFVNVTSCPSIPLSVDFKSDQVIQVYSRLYEASKNAGLNIQRDEVGSGMALYVFQLQEPVSGREYFTLRNAANCRLEIEFSAPLPVSVSVLLYSENDQVIQIDEARNVTLS